MKFINNRMKLRINIRTISLLLAALIFFAWSYLLLIYYVEGDQVTYHKFYLLSKDIRLNELLTFGKDLLDSYEIISLFFLWLGSNLGFEKNFYISLLNLILATGIFLFLKKAKVPWYIYFFTFTNFYLIVLMVAAERLKVAFIFLVYAALFSKRINFFLATMSIFAHVQSIILLLSIFLHKASLSLNYLSKKFFVTKKKLFYFLILIIFTNIIFFFTNYVLFFYGYIFDKAMLYYDYVQLIKYYPLKTFFLVIPFLIITRQPFRLFISMAPLIVLAWLLGDFRINMIIFIVGMYLLIIEGRSNHPLAIVMMLYFSLKSLPFIYRIYLYGHGF